MALRIILQHFAVLLIGIFPSSTIAEVLQFDKVTFVEENNSGSSGGWTQLKFRVDGPRVGSESATETSFPSLLILVRPHRLIALILDPKKIGWINVGIRVPQGWKNIWGQVSYPLNKSVKSYYLGPIQKLFWRGSLLIVTN